MPRDSAHFERTLIIGATSSLAQAICRELARRGGHFILSGRDEAELETLAADLLVRYGARSDILAADLSEPGFSPQRHIAEAGDFDSMVIAAGDMGAADPKDMDALEATTRINYLIPAQLAAYGAENLATRGGGTIGIISSVAGDRGRQSNFAYGSAKAALSTFASGLRNLYFRRGVHVATIKPGFVDTPMTWGMKSPLIAPRDAVARQIIQALEKRKNVIYVPFFWRFIMLAIMHIPEALFKKLKL